MVGIGSELPRNQEYFWVNTCEFFIINVLWWPYSLSNLLTELPLLGFPPSSLIDSGPERKGAGEDMGMCALPVQTEFHAKVGILTLGFSRAHAYKIHLEGFLKYWILKTSPDFLNQNLFLTRVPNESYEEASLAKKKKKTCATTKF